MPQAAKSGSCGSCSGDAVAKPADGYGKMPKLIIASHCSVLERTPRRPVTEPARFLGLAEPSADQSRRPRRKMRGRGGWPTGRAVSSIRNHRSGCGKRNFLTLYFLRGRTPQRSRRVVSMNINSSAERGDRHYTNLMLAAPRGTINSDVPATPGGREQPPHR
jgi:hypothetical protein